MSTLFVLFVTQPIFVHKEHFRFTFPHEHIRSLSIKNTVNCSLSKMLTTPILDRLDSDDDFTFVDLTVEPDAEGHPRPEIKSEVLQFLIHALGGCRACNRICGPGASLWILGLHLENLHPGDK